MDTKGIVVHIVLIVMAFITVGIFIDEIYYLRQKCTSTLRRRLTVIQVFFVTKYKPLKFILNY